MSFALDLLVKPRLTQLPITQYSLWRYIRLLISKNSADWLYFLPSFVALINVRNSLAATATRSGSAILVIGITPRADNDPSTAQRFSPLIDLGLATKRR